MIFFALFRELARKWPVVLPALAGVALFGCHSHFASSRPKIDITVIPPTGPGGDNEISQIEGHVAEAQQGQQVVLYAYSNLWWIQPLAPQPFTTIQHDSSWKSWTHLGSKYAALLVEPGYHPDMKRTTLPNVGNGVVAISVVNGTSGKKTPLGPLKAIHFSGYDWTVRPTPSERGGEVNAYDPVNVWTDSKGSLHLRMEERAGKWSCADVELNRSLGYGTYRFVVQDSAHMAPSAVVELYTWDAARSDNHRDELDIDLSKWSNPNGDNLKYVVQPFYVPTNSSAFMAPSGRLTHILRWQPGSASFKTIGGTTAGRRVESISEHTFTSDVPTPAGERIHMALFDYHHSRSGLKEPVEIVIERFEYVP